MKSQSMIYKLLVLAALSVSAFTAVAQTTLLNQQWNSRVNRNPAAAASGVEALNFSLFYHSQWSGIEGAPVTTLFNADTYLKGINSGLGLTVSYDQQGLSRSNLNAMFSYAYLVHLNENWKLSLGLSAGFMHMNNDPSKNQFASDADMSIPAYKVKKFTPDFNTGAELSCKGFTAGLALDHLLYGNPGTFDDPQTPREFYMYAQYNFHLNTDMSLMPQLSWYYFSGVATNTIDLGAVFAYRNFLTVGASWMVNNAAVFMAGVEFSGIQLGYAYQMSVGDVAQLSKSTHELMLRVKLDYKK